MGIAAFLCIALGVNPKWLYSILPYNIDYAPYTTTHVVTQLQLLFFAALAFGWLIRTGLYPPDLKSINLDFDWIYRRLFPNIIRHTSLFVVGSDRAFRNKFLTRLNEITSTLFRYHGPEGILARTSSLGASVAVIVAILTLFVLLFFLNTSPQDNF